jgi:DNA polymerase
MRLTRQDRLAVLELLPAWKLRAKAVAEHTAEANIAEENIAVANAVPANPAQSTPANPPEADFAQMSLSDLQSYLLCAGDPQAAWLFIGDPADAMQQDSKQPFTGEAGALLDKMLAAIQLSRAQNTYFAHCDNLAAMPRLLALLQPKLIVALGEPVSQSLLNQAQPLASLRGKLHSFQGVPLIASYAPSHLLQYPEAKRQAWQDLQLARDTMLSINASQPSISTTSKS